MTACSPAGCCQGKMPSDALPVPVPLSCPQYILPMIYGISSSMPSSSMYYSVPANGVLLAAQTAPIQPSAPFCILGSALQPRKQGGICENGWQAPCFPPVSTLPDPYPDGLPNPQAFEGVVFSGSRTCKNRKENTCRQILLRIYAPDSFYFLLLKITSIFLSFHKFSVTFCKIL